MSRAHSSTSSIGSTTTRTQTTGDSPRIHPRSPTASEDFARDFALTLWTADPVLARSADAAGIQRVGLDLERIGKAQRQRGLGTWISPHHAAQLPELGEQLTGARLFARVNPLHRDSAAEVETVLAHGAQVLMLPMFERPEEVAGFLALVGGRATVVPLLETRAAAQRIDELMSLGGIEETHIGINDLALSLGARNRFEVLFAPELERAAAAVTERGLRLGLGAIGRVGDRALPIDPDLIYARIVALGARGALIARSFAAPQIPAAELRDEIARARRRLSRWHAAPVQDLDRAGAALREAVARCRRW